MSLTWMSCSTPLSAYPTGPMGLDGIAFYIGGDTPHVWTLAEIHNCPYRYRLPIFVRSNPTATGVTAATDVAEAVAQLKYIGAPQGCMVAWDSETSVDPEYIKQVYADLSTAGYKLIDYGSQSMVFGNEEPDGYYWGADWTNISHVAVGNAMTQWISLAGWEDSISTTPLPWWDTKPAPGKPPAPPGQWNNPATWTWEDCLVLGVGLDGKLHCFHMGPAGQWILWS